MLCQDCGKREEVKFPLPMNWNGFNEFVRKHKNCHTMTEEEHRQLTQRLVDVLDAMWSHYVPTNDPRYLAARDILNKAEKAGFRPPDEGVDLDEFDMRPTNRFGVRDDDFL